MTVAVAGAAAPRAGIRFGLVLGVLGVVYGDIGTSPLFAFRARHEHFSTGGVAEYEVFGILSLIFWSLVLIVTVKYVLPAGDAARRQPRRRAASWR